MGKYGIELVGCNNGVAALQGDHYNIEDPLYTYIIHLSTSDCSPSLYSFLSHDLMLLHTLILDLHNLHTYSYNMTVAKQS